MTRNKNTFYMKNRLILFNWHQHLFLNLGGSDNLNWEGQII